MPISGIASSLVRFLFFLDFALLARLAVSYRSSMCSINSFAVLSSAFDAFSSSISNALPSVYSIAAAVCGAIPVVSSIGDKSPLDGLSCRFIALCTSFTTSGHCPFVLPNFLHNVLRIVSTFLLFASATPCAHFAYGVHIVCFIPLASVSFSTILLQKCVPPSECISFGSGYTDRYCSSNTFTTVSASAFLVGCSIVVSEKSSVIHRIYLHPLIASSNCMKLM